MFKDKINLQFRCKLREYRKAIICMQVRKKRSEQKYYTWEGERIKILENLGGWVFSTKLKIQFAQNLNTARPS